MEKMTLDILSSFDQLQCSLSNPMNNQVLIMGDDKGLCFMEFANKARATGKELIGFMGSRSEIIGSCDGILCLLSLQTDQPTILITNPLTNQKIVLPKLDFISSQNPIQFCGFGYDLTTKSYKVVLVPLMYMFLTIPQVMVHDGKSTNWRCIRYRYLVCGKDNINGYPKAFLNGRLHWITNYGIISYDLSDEEFRRIDSPRDRIDWYDPFFGHGLTVLGECLCVVRFYNYRDKRLRLQIWVMRRYDVYRSWSMDRHDIFLPAFKGMEYRGTKFEVLGEVENGKILLKFDLDKLVLIDPTQRKVECPEYPKLPRTATASLHMITPNWILT